MSEQKMSYEEIMEAWAEAYKFCIKFEAAIALGEKASEEEMNEYLESKATLIVSTADIFVTKCMDDKGEFDKGYINELYGQLKETLNKEGIKLLSFDEEYIQGMIDELDESMIQEAAEEREIQVETEPKTDSSEDEQQD